MILALLIVLSLCGSAFAANEQLTVTSETAREGDTIVTRYFFRNAEGTLVYAQDFYYNQSGTKVRDETFSYDEDGRLIYQRITGMKNGVWTDEEAKVVYQPDGSSTEETHVVWNNPGGKKEYAYVVHTEDANGNTTETQEHRDDDGNQLYFVARESGVKESGEKYESVDTKYRDGRTESVVTRTLADGTTVILTDKTGTSGKKYMDGFWQIDPDGSYLREERTIGRSPDGAEIAIQNKEYNDEAGNIRVEEYKMIYDEDGYGRGKGILRDASGNKLADLLVQNYEEEDENNNTVGREITTYLYLDGTVDLRYVTLEEDGGTSVRFERDVKDYDGGEDELPEDTDWDGDEWDVDNWDIDDDKWTAFVYEDTYPGNPTEETAGYENDSSGDNSWNVDDWDGGDLDGGDWDGGDWDGGDWDGGDWDGGDWDGGDLDVGDWDGGDWD